MIADRIMHVKGKEIGKSNPIIAEAPWALSTATHAISCNTFNAEKNLEPKLPKVDFMVSIAFNLMRAPISPVKNSNIPPMMCPRINGSQMVLIGAEEASCIPASISETEIATPNQMTAFEKSPVCSSIFCPLKSLFSIDLCFHNTKKLCRFKWV